MTKRYLPGTLNPLYENRSPYDLDTAEFNNPYYIRQLIKSFMGRNLEQNLFAGQGGETFNAIILGPDKFTFNNKDTGYATPVSALTKNEEHTWYHFRIPELHACLTDPCSPRVLKDRTKAFNAIKDHPSAPFVGGGSEKKIPSLDPGTVVEIKFERGPTVGMAIQPTITRVLSRAFGLVNVPEECEKILDAFAKANGYSTNRIHSRSTPSKDTTLDELPGAVVVNKLDETVGRSNIPLPPSNVTFIALHYTAGFDTKAAAAVLAKDGTAYHYIISRSGQIQQFEKIDQIAYASGGGDAMPGANSISISVAFVNVGYWRPELGISETDARNWPVCPGSGITQKLPWQPYTDAQISALTQLVNSLQAKTDPDGKLLFPKLFGDTALPGYGDVAAKIIGHEQVSGGKSDPGPAFWLKYNAKYGTSLGPDAPYSDKCTAGAAATDEAGALAESDPDDPLPDLAESRTDDYIAATPADCTIAADLGAHEHSGDLAAPCDAPGYTFYDRDELTAFGSGWEKCPAGCYKD